MFIDVIQKAVLSVWEQIVAAFPKLIGAIVLLLLGWILAKLISGLVDRLLRRLQVDKLADRLNQTKTFQEANLKIQPVKIIKQFLYWIILLIFILSAAETLELDIATEQVGALIAYLPKLITALFILGLGFYMADALKDLVGNACKSLGIPAWKVISAAVFYLLLLVVVVTALNQAGIDTEIITSNVSVILGGVLLAFAIAYGFAARNILGSILASFYSRGNFEVGQVIEVDGYKGEIIKMDQVSFTLDTGTVHIVFPLSRLTQDRVVIYPTASDAGPD
ncbi:MAG: hypothetical protein OHK0039_24410 [Bacteroidia bacterium]